MLEKLAHLLLGAGFGDVPDEQVHVPDVLAPAAVRATNAHGLETGALFRLRGGSAADQGCSEYRQRHIKGNHLKYPLEFRPVIRIARIDPGYDATLCREQDRFPLPRPQQRRPNHDRNGNALLTDIALYSQREKTIDELYLNKRAEKY
ncbi:MAG TPA: hypothetical protein VG105_03525 [Paraburkholderia sp.]|jgi:hypothetical protein|nr:hypothetical protein [Paraburkholderia sp.]